MEIPTKEAEKAANLKCVAQPRLEQHILTGCGVYYVDWSTCDLDMYTLIN